MSTISERVQRGVEWLDRALPDWWKTHYIELDSFRMSDGCRCVIGQLYRAVEHPDEDIDDDDESAFNVAVDDRWLDLDWPSAVRFGFFAMAAGGTDASAAEYGDLTAEWTRVITEKREATK